MKSVDLSNFKLIAQRDLEAAGQNGAKEVVIREGAVITPSARDALHKYGLTLRTNGHNSHGASTATAPAASKDRLALFRSPEAEALKAEIIAEAMQKKW